MHSAARFVPTRRRAASCSGWPRLWPASIKPRKRSRCTGGPSTGPQTSITSSTWCASSPNYTFSAASSTGFSPDYSIRNSDERRPGEETRGRDVAHVHGAGPCVVGRSGQHRAELEKLLATDTRDTRLLEQLSKLAEEEGDLETAARYQKMHEELAASDEGQARLATLLAKSGDLEEAQAAWSKAAAGKSQSFRVFLAMDNLLSNGKPQPVLEITEASLRKDPSDWEALYRQGQALEGLGRPKEALARFAKLIDLTVSDDEKSALAKAGAEPSTPSLGNGEAAESRHASIDDAARKSSRKRLYDSLFLQGLAHACSPRLFVVAGRLRAGPNGRAGLAREPCRQRASRAARTMRSRDLWRLPGKPLAIFARSGTGSISAACAKTTPARSRPPRN